MVCSLVCVGYVLGTVGNYLVCSVVYSDPTMQTVLHLILVNLAAAGLICCLLNLPITFSLFVCNCKPEIFTVLRNIHWVLTAAVTCLVCACHVLLSIDRYDAVIRHFNRRITKDRMKAIAMGLWALGLVLAILTIVLVSTSTVLWLPVNTAPNSIDTKLSTNLMIALGVSIAVLVGMISAMMYSYFRVKCTVRQHKQQLIQMLGQENLNTEMRLTRMFVLVVLCFVVTTFPYLIYGIMYSVKGENNYIIETVAYAALPFSHVVNPMIYAQFVSGLWRAMERKLKILFGCQIQQVHPVMQMNAGP